jgi:hypothetical protein
LKTQQKPEAVQAKLRARLQWTKIEPTSNSRSHTHFTEQQVCVIENSPQRVQQELKKLEPLIRWLKNNTDSCKILKRENEDSQNESKSEIFGALWLGWENKREQMPMGALHAG